MAEIRNFTDEFASPSAAYRGKPFWAWNGALDQKELLRQAENCKTMGFGGFFMHSRTGLETEYLGEEWFSLINACADRAKELGLEAWLYDEDRWPSGTAGGMITKNPAYRLHYLEMLRDAEPTAALFADCEAVFATTEQDGILTASRRLNGPEDALRDGERLTAFRVCEMEKSSFYNGYTYVDTMNREATDAFIASTHRKYVENCGARIGDSIRGVFTDEPHRGGVMTSFAGPNGPNRVPYTAKLYEKFREKYGSDLVAQLPELFLKPSADGVAPVKWQFVELLEELFLDNFAKPILQYCRANGLRLTGHVLHENSLAAQTAMSGSVMRYYEWMDDPGIDYLGREEPCYWIAKQLQSVARQLDKKTLLSELYGCTGWHTTLQDYKKIGGWQALYGINLRCPHLSWYTMEGQAKRDYPASIFHQSTWWKEYAALETYFARWAVFGAQGKPDCRVLVINPVESIWAQIRTGWCSGLSSAAPEAVKLEENYAALYNIFQRSHIDYDYGDEGILAEHAAVENGSLRVGSMQYACAVVSGALTLRGSTRRLLRDFAAAGGRVIVCGEAPVYADCLPAAWDIPSVQIPLEKEAVAREFADFAEEILTPGGENEEHLLCQTRCSGSEKYRMILNLDGGTLTARMRTGTGKVLRFYPETGRYSRIEADADGFVTLDFAPDGAALLLTGSSLAAEPEPAKAAPGGERLLLDGSYAYTLDEDNICVLDRASVSVDGGAFSEPLEVLRADRRVRDAFGLAYRGGEMLQPWFTKSIGVQPCGRIRHRYVFEIAADPGPLQLVLEDAEKKIIRFNGQEVRYVPDGFYWVDCCMKRVMLPQELLREGTNTVEIEESYDAASGLEAMYLMGRFAVRADVVPVLEELPEKLALRDLCTQGLPFYSGKVTYRLPVPALQSGARLRVGRFGAACLAVGKEQKPLCWAPWETELDGCIEDGILEVTAVLTRRNTFGPLHAVPAVTSALGPGNFETAGADFTDRYQLIEAGLLGPVEIWDGPSAE